MHKEECCDEVLGSSPDGGERVGEPSIQEPRQGKVEVAGEGETDLPIHLTQRPLHRVPCTLHHLTQIL